MWSWIVQNKEWVFSGAGIAVLGVLWWLVTEFWMKREAAVSTTQAPNTVQAPNSSIAPVIAPVISMNPTINFPIGPSVPEPPQQLAPPAAPVPTTPKARPNLCVEAIKTGKITLQGDIWTLRPNTRGYFTPSRALLADISNVPTDSADAARARIRAAIRMDYGGQQRTYSPLPWLEEFMNIVYLETGARKTVVLAVGRDSAEHGLSC